MAGPLPADQTPLKRNRILRVLEQRLRDKQCVLGIVAHHPATQEEAVTPLTCPAALDSLSRHARGRQPKCVAHRRAQEDSGEGLPPSGNAGAPAHLLAASLAAIVDGASCHTFNSNLSPSDTTVRSKATRRS